MTRLFLIIFLFLSSSPVYAEWVELYKLPEDRMTAYVDPETIRRKGNLVKMWQLYDYKTIQTVESSSYLSSNGQIEFDCAEERTRVLAFTHFSGNMGSGKVVYSYSDEDKWVPIAPRSGYQRMWEVACEKK